MPPECRRDANARAGAADVHVVCRSVPGQVQHAILEGDDNNAIRSNAGFERLWRRREGNHFQFRTRWRPQVNAKKRSGTGAVWTKIVGPTFPKTLSELQFVLGAEACAGP